MSAIDDILAKDASEIDVLEWAVILMPKEKAEEAAEKLSKIRNALKFYEDPKRYDGPNQNPVDGDPFRPEDCPYLWDVLRDRGDIARVALENK
jgi:hypothetical protein